MRSAVEKRLGEEMTGDLGARKEDVKKASISCPGPPTLTSSHRSISIGFISVACTFFKILPACTLKKSGGSSPYR